MDKHSATELYYDSLAELYDSATSKVGAWNAPLEVREALKIVGHASSALIIGVGTGQDIEGLNGLHVKHIEGVDLSVRMLDICRAKYPSIILHQADFMSEVSLTIPQYDLIVCSGTSEFISDVRALFSKCASLLTKGGCLLFTFEPLIDHHSIQSEPQSLSRTSATGNAPAHAFITYRRRLFEILEIASSNSLIPIFHKEYVSYRKGDVDIIYHLVLFRVPKQSKQTKLNE